MMVGVIKISNSFWVFFFEFVLKNLRIKGRSPRIGNFPTVKSSWSNIKPPINSVSPLLTITLVVVVRLDTMGYAVAIHNSIIKLR